MDAHAQLDELLRQMEKFKSDLEALPSAGRMTQVQADAVYALAYDALARGRHEEAARHFAILLLYNPTNKVYLTGLARSLQRLRRHDEAVTAYSFLAVIDPLEPAHALGMAECLLLRHDHAQGRESLARVIRFCRETPGHQKTLDRALALLELVKPREAARGS